MLEEGNRVNGKMRFHGFHREELFGVPPSGQHVLWSGMPIFTFEGTKVRDLFVLGDPNSAKSGPSRNARYVLEGGPAVEPLGFRPLPTSGPIAIPLGRGVA
jgi:hypothetical protein